MNIMFSICNSLIIFFLMMFTGAAAASDLAPLEINEVRVSMHMDPGLNQDIYCEGGEFGVNLSKASPSGHIDSFLCVTYDFLLDGNKVKVTTTTDSTTQPIAYITLTSKAITPSLRNNRPYLTTIVMDPAIGTSFLRVKGSNGIIPSVVLGGEPVQFYSIGDDPITIDTTTSDFVIEGVETHTIVEFWSVK